jgi:alanine-synthesizing transaminase
LNWGLSVNPLSRLLDEKRAAGAKLLDLTESNPTRAGLSYPSSEILAAISADAAMRYDPAPRGAPEARAAVAAYYAERGIVVDPARILLTASTSEAYSYLFKLLCDPGDEVLTPRPSYPLFEFLAGLESVQVRQYPLRYDGEWHVDFDALRAAITARTRAVVVVNPNNPTGSFLKLAELERLEALGADHGIAILSDEVFFDYAFADGGQALGLRRPLRPPDVIPSRAESSAQAKGLPPNALTFSMSGLSKIAGLPQMKLGWIVANGPRPDDAISRLELIADTFLSISTPVQVALPKLLTSAKVVQDQIRTRTAANLASLQDALTNSSASVLRVEGGWYAILKLPRTRSEEDWVITLLRDHDVVVQPGFFFDFESEAFLVVSLLTESSIFAEGVRRIRAII